MALPPVLCASSKAVSLLEAAGQEMLAVVVAAAEADHKTAGAVAVGARREAGRKDCREAVAAEAVSTEVGLLGVGV